MSDSSTLTELIGRGLSGPALTAASMVFVLAAVSRVLAEQFDTWAKRMGPLGRVWVSRRDRRLAAVAAERTQLLELAELRVLTKQQAERINQLVGSPLVVELKAQMDDMIGIIKTLRTHVEVTDAYLLADADWHRMHDLGEHPPRHLNFREFRRRFNEEAKRNDAHR